VALASLRPWETDSVAPQVWISPEVGIGLDDSVALAPAGGPGIAAARVAPSGYDAAIAKVPVAVPENVSAPVLDVAAARPVSVSQPATVPARPPSGVPSPPPSVALPAPVAVAPAPAPAAVLVVLPPSSQPPAVVGSDGGPGDFDSVEIREGDEYALSFSFYLETTTFAEPGTENLIMQFSSDADDAHSFDLQLWEDPDFGLVSRGLWSSGEAVGGDRFLGPVEEGVWHDVFVPFEASGQDAGFYEVYLDGQLVDARSGVSLIASGSDHAQIEVGLFRDGGPVEGTSEIRIDEARLSESLEPALP